MKSVLSFSALICLAAATAACGGSSSETPFPERPVEPELLQRHGRVYESGPAGAEGQEQPTRTQDAPSSAPSPTAGPSGDGF